MTPPLVCLCNVALNYYICQGLSSGELKETFRASLLIRGKRLSLDRTMFATKTGIMISKILCNEYYQYVHLYSLQNEQTQQIRVALYTSPEINVPEQSTG